MPNIIDFSALKIAVAKTSLPLVKGRVLAIDHQWVEAQLVDARVGMRVTICDNAHGTIPAEVVACGRDTVKLMPLTTANTAARGDEVLVESHSPSIPCGRGLLGRIIDPFGRSIDGGPALTDVAPWPLNRPAPNSLTRQPVDRQLVTGIRAIDGCLPIGRGQRLGLFADAGLGKSTLLGMLAKRTRCDVAVVALVGERGREVLEFVNRVLGPGGLQHSVVVLAPAAASLLARSRAIETATAMAEWFRAAGQHCLLLVDSLTRALAARRDLALVLGEPPTRGDFPPSVFSSLPQLLERTGCDETGSITAIYAVLTTGHGHDPIAEEVKSLLDGHIRLSARLAKAGIYPAIDLLNSVSRVAKSILPMSRLNDIGRLLALLSAYDTNEDLILMGAYRRGTSPDTDRAIDRKPHIDRFRGQPVDEFSTLEQTRDQLRSLLMDK